MRARRGLLLLGLWSLVAWGGALWLTSHATRERIVVGKGYGFVRARCLSCEADTARATHRVRLAWPAR